jgi:hypothetical protein
MVGTIVGTIAIVLVVIVVGLLVDRKYAILPRPSDLAPEKPAPPPYAAGEAPATAIRARAGQQAKLREQRCAKCRVAMTPLPDDSVRYDDRELLVLGFACPACQARRSLYVERVG